MSVHYQKFYFEKCLSTECCFWLWKRVEWSKTQHNFAFRAHLSNHLYIFVLGLTEGFPFFSVKVTNRVTRVCKAIVDAIVPKWADIDCSPHKLLAAPLIHYTRCLPKWSGARSATPGSMMLMGSPACLISYTLNEKNADSFTVIFTGNSILQVSITKTVYYIHDTKF